MVKAKNIVKKFGTRYALKGISFEVNERSVVGFLGPNGAGKTTTMRILTGYLTPTDGSAEVAGYDVERNPLQVKARVGYMPESPPIYAEMTVKEFLAFVADIKGIPPKNKRASIEKVIEETAIGDVQNRLIGRLSRGYRQRVGLAQSLIHDPQVLILDEPTAGLDPIQIHEIRELIKKLGQDRTVLLSTHILPEVTQTCTRAIIIHEGSILVEDTLSNLMQTLAGGLRVRLKVKRNPDSLLLKIQEMDEVRLVRCEDDSILVEFQRGKDKREEIADIAVKGNHGLLEFSTQALTLEEVFLKLTTEESL